MNDKLFEVSTNKELPVTWKSIKMERGQIDLSDVQSIGSAEEKKEAMDRDNKETNFGSLELRDYNEVMANQANNFNVSQKEFMDQIMLNLTKTNHQTVKEAIEEMMYRLKNDCAHQHNTFTNCDESHFPLKDSVGASRQSHPGRRRMRSQTLIGKLRAFKTLLLLQTSAC